MSSSNACIWKVENNTDQIKYLLGLDYTNEARVYEWIPENHEIAEKTFTIDGLLIKYIRVSATLDIFIQGQKVKTSSDVLFINKNDFNYCIVLGSRPNESRIRNNLMKSGKTDDPKWGKVSFKELPEFTSNKSFYYWILNNSGKVLTKDGKSLELSEVRGFKGNTERNQRSYYGEGSNIDNFIPLKSLVSTNEDLISLNCVVLFNSIKYSFSLDYDGRLSIDWAACGEHATQNPHPISEEKILIGLYFDIIPFLRTLHNESVSNGWAGEESSFRKRYAMDIIKELMTENNVGLDELA